MNDSCSPKGLIIQLIKLAHRLEDTAERCFFAPHGLTMPAGRILMVLGRLGQASPSVLMKLVECTKSNLSQRLATLEKAGLVLHQKPKQENDQRHVTIVLTDKGRERANALIKQFDTAIAELEDSIPKQDWDGVLNVLHLLHQKIDQTSSTSH